MTLISERKTGKNYLNVQEHMDTEVPTTHDEQNLNPVTTMCGEEQ